MMSLVKFLIAAIACSFFCPEVSSFSQGWSKPCPSHLSEYCLGQGTCRRVTSMDTIFCACAPGFQGSRCQYRLSDVNLPWPDKRDMPSSMIRHLDLTQPDTRSVSEWNILTDVPRLADSQVLDTPEVKQTPDTDEPQSIARKIYDIKSVNVPSLRRVISMKHPDVKRAQYNVADDKLVFTNGKVGLNFSKQNP